MELLFTGASGFIGLNIKSILEKKYSVTTVGISEEDDFNVDISKERPVFNKRFDIVLHAAGKAHSIPKTKLEAQSFFDINYLGTIMLCQSLEQVGLPKAFIFISTVAVYGVDTGENITENFELLGNTPYALSKIQAESYLIKWCKGNGVVLSIIRPSLIAGPNPPGNLGSMINGIKNRRYFRIGEASARKSVLMVHDIAFLIPFLVDKGGVFNVCDDYPISFKEIDEIISLQLGTKKPFSIPYWIAKFIAFCGDCFGERAPINSFKLKKITRNLTFSNEKAKRELGWRPLSVIENFKIS